MSDPRPHMEGIPINRRVLAIRVIIGKPGTNFHFNFRHVYCGTLCLHKSLKKRTLEQNENVGDDGWNKLQLDSRVDMCDPRCKSTDWTEELLYRFDFLVFVWIQSQ